MVAHIAVVEEADAVDIVVATILSLVPIDPWLELSRLLSIQVSLLGLVISFRLGVRLTGDTVMEI